MFGIGTPELLVILLVALIVLGPKRIPEVARALGKGLAELRKATSGFTQELNQARWMLEEEIRAAERAKLASSAAAPPGDAVTRDVPSRPATETEAEAASSEAPTAKPG